MNETRLTNPRLPLELRSFLACLATILELPIDQLPDLPGDDDPAGSWHVSRWLGGHGLGLVPIAEPATFAWAGPWIARVAPPQTERRYVVMYGVPSGIVWDPDGSDAPRDPIDAGFVIAAGDIALAMPPRSAVPTTTGTVAAIYIAAAAGEPTHALPAVQALAGEGLAGDRHVAGTGTFPSNLPGSALTLIEAEVCESFDPPLEAHEHRRNLVTRGIQLNGLVGREFMVGDVRCRGMRLCEPCTVVQGYSSRPVLRPLVHRGGIRADILTDGTIHSGDPVQVLNVSGARSFAPSRWDSSS
jgi:MOSC domain